MPISFSKTVNSYPCTVSSISIAHMVLFSSENRLKCNKAGFMLKHAQFKIQPMQSTFQAKYPFFSVQYKISCKIPWSVICSQKTNKTGNYRSKRKQGKTLGKTIDSGLNTNLLLHLAPITQNPFLLPLNYFSFTNLLIKSTRSPCSKHKKNHISMPTQA